MESGFYRKSTFQTFLGASGNRYGIKAQLSNAEENQKNFEDFGKFDHSALWGVMVSLVQNCVHTGKKSS